MARMVTTASFPLGSIVRFMNGRFAMHRVSGRPRERAGGNGRGS